MVDDIISGLEQKINELLSHYQSLKVSQANYKKELAEVNAEYHTLKERYEALLGRHEQAVSGIERMINRLKTVQEEA